MSDHVSYGGPGHYVVIGAPRCNKTAGILIPNILSLDDRPLIIFNDCRGEIYETVIRHRRTRGPCLLINPLGLRGYKSSGFNLMVDLDPNKPNFYSSGLAYGEGLIARRPNDNQPIFNLGAQTLVSIFAMMAKLAFGEKASHAKVQQMIAMAQIPGKSPNPEETDPTKRIPGAASRLIEMAMQGDYSPDPDHGAPSAYPQYDIRNGGKPFEPLQLLATQFMAKAGQDNRFFQDRVATAQTEMGKLSDPQLMEDMAKTPKFGGVPFEFSRMRQYADLDRKKGVFTVFVMIPPKFFVTHAVYMRALINNAINSLMASEPGPDTPLTPLIIIEEMAQLGKIAAVENSINMAAGNGLQYMMVFQQLSKMRDAYGQEGVGTILDACDVKLCFCSEDGYTQEYMSNLGGMKGEWVKSFHDERPGVSKTGQFANHTQQSVPLIRPQDIRDLKKGELFAWIKHAPPVKLSAPGYFDTDAWPELRGKWDVNSTLPMNQRSAA